LPPARTEFNAGLRAGLSLLVAVAPFVFVRGLRYVPAAVLTAIWAPELLLQKGVLSLALGNERLLAGMVAIAVAWRYRVTFGTIVAGLAALHLFDWMF
jgi:branched-subunit amino acid transport protein